MLLWQGREGLGRPSLRAWASQALRAAEARARCPYRFVADRLQYLAWGAPAVTANRLAKPPAGAGATLAADPLPADLIRVWLTTTGHGGVFTESLARSLTDAEHTAFQDPQGGRLPKPTPAGPKPFSVFRDRLQDGTEGPPMVALPGR